MKNLIAKYRAPLALLLAAALGIFGVHQYNAAKVNGGVATAIAEAKAHPLAPVTVKQAPPVHLFGVVKGKPIAWVFDPKLNVVTFVHLTFGATGDNPAGWSIDPTTGALVAPSGKVIKGVSFVDSPAAVGTANVASLSGTQTVDGVSVTAGKKAWLFGQTTTTQDGCWIGAAGAWARCTELATGDDAAGMYFAVGAGTANKGAWIVTNAAGGGIAGTNDLVGLNLSTLSGGGLTSPLSANLDFGTNRGIHIGSPQAIDDAVDALTLNAHLIRVTALSTKPISAYTYANGASGVGATITGNTNAACDTIDGQTLQVGVAGQETFLFRHGVAQSDDGVYKITQNGDGSTVPCIFTRSTTADTSAKILGSKVRVRFGLQYAGAELEVPNPAALTIGTSPIFYSPTTTQYSNLVVDITDDFLGGFAGFAAQTELPSPLRWLFVPTGTGANYTTAANSRTEYGIGVLTPGSTATGASVLVVNASFPSHFLANSDELIVSARVKWSALSDGTTTYNDQIGLGSANSLAGTDGVWLEYKQATQTTFRCTARAGSASTIANGPTLVAGTWYRWEARKYGGDTTLHEYIDNTECGTGFTTGQWPAGVGLTPMVQHIKSLGAGVPTVSIDKFRVRVVPDGSFAP